MPGRIGCAQRIHLSTAFSDIHHQKGDLALALGSVYAWTDWTSIRFSAYRYFFFLSDLAIA